MQVVELIQGSEAWHAHRAKHFNSSDSAAALGVSPYKSRPELLTQLATGIVPGVDAATQRRFDDGHRFEALARPIAESLIGEDLFPCIGVADSGPLAGKLSASFDGLTMAGNIAFEHKSLNDELRRAFAEIESISPDYRDRDGGRLLPLHYRIQMESQILVCPTIERVLFMASKWVGDDLVEEGHCWYYSDPDLAVRVVAGWEKVEGEAQRFIPEATAPKVVGKNMETLPALVVRVTGAVTESNLPAFREHAMAVLTSIKRELKTDQDFADAEKTVKWCSDVEDRIKAAKKGILGQVASIDEASRILDDLGAETRQIRLDLDKLIRSEKESRKAALVVETQEKLRLHYDKLNKQLGANYMQAPAGVFAPVIKGLKSLDSMSDKLVAALIEEEAKATATATRLQANRDALRGDAHDWIFLFPDFSVVGNKDPEDFSAIMQLRIRQHEDATEAKRKADEAQRTAQAARAPDPVAPAGPAQEDLASDSPSPGLGQRRTVVPSTGDLVDQCDLRDEDVDVIPACVELTEYIAAAFFGVRGKPKPSADWWEGLRERVERLQPELYKQVEAPF